MVASCNHFYRLVATISLHMALSIDMQLFEQAGSIVNCNTDSFRLSLYFHRIFSFSFIDTFA